MTQWEGLDRRKFPRYNYPCLVVIKNGVDQANEVILTHTENIGIGGVCVTLKKEVKVFSSVDIELDLMDMGNHIKCKGKVVWNIRRNSDVGKKPLFYDIGIEFQDLDVKEHERLKEIVQRLSKSGLGPLC